jgi:class 3 adenylate cyclase
VQLPVLVPKRFAPAVEADYRTYRTAQVVPFERLASIAGAISIAGTFLWDIQMDPSAFPETLWIRLGMAAILLMLLAVTYTPLGERHRFTQLAATTTIFAGFSWVLSELDNGFIVGVAGLTVSMTLLPLVTPQFTSMLAFGALAMIIPNLFLAIHGPAYVTRVTIVNLNVWLGLAVVLAAAFWAVLDMVNRRLFLAERELAAEQRRSDGLLKNILPEEIAEQLKHSHESVSARFDSVTVLFADLVGFTSFARTREPDVVVRLLNSLFSRFDEIVLSKGLEKIKTIGDGYMAAGGVPAPLANHAGIVADAALEMMDATQRFRAEQALPWELRIGIHSGSVVAGVIGTHKFAYDLWGDAVNVASRMESSGLPGRIQLSGDTADLLPAAYVLETRGAVSLKNRGRLETFFLLGRDPAPAEPTG